MFIPMIALLAAIIVAVGSLAMLEFGRIVGRRRRARGLEPGSGGAIEGAVFAVFGLLVAFTFSGAASRFDERRTLINHETNAIGTAWLRLDLLPEAFQPAIRDEMRRYLDDRLNAYRNVDNLEEARRHLSESQKRQGEIWRQAILATRDTPPSTATLLLPALNEAFDIASTRLAVTMNHPPAVIFIMLVALALVCAFLAGNGLATDHPNRVHAVGFAVVIALVVYVILDLEYPRFGFIRIDDTDKLLIDLRASLGTFSAL